MYYRFRNRDGTEGLSHLAVIDTKGEVTAVKREAVTLVPLGQWRSAGGTEYPSGWRLKIADRGLDLRIEPVVEDQLMDLSVKYWEGAVVVSGSHQGRGYVELAGYE